MFVERLLNQGNAPLLEQMLKFTAARHRLIAENVTNATTPNYRQKDLSVEKFQKMLLSRVKDKNESAPGTVGFSDIQAELEHPNRGILFHDGGNRSMEQLVTDQAKNAMTHNLVVELLRKQYTSLENALMEKIG